MDKSLKWKIAAGVVVVVILLFIVAAFILIPRIYHLSAKADYTFEDVSYKNPLQGFAYPAEDTENGQEGQLVYIGLTWAQWEPHPGVFDVEGLEEKFHIEQWKKEGKHAVLRFICDIPGSEPHMDIPQWLYERTGDGVFYDMDYGKGYAPVYENTDFVEAHKKALEALGEYCSKDTFVSYVELGSLGHWGEWHTKYSAGVPAMPDEDVCWEYANQYADNFVHARLLMRRNYVMAVEGKMGVYNDMTGAAEDTQEWLDWQKNGGAYEVPGRKIPYAPIEDIWKLSPVGGEFTSSVPMEEMLTDRLPETLSLIGKSHMTFLGPKCPEGEETQLPGTREVEKLLGYRYWISQMEVKMDYFGQSFEVKLVWENNGSAPIYFEWPAMMYVYDKDGNQKYWEEINIDLTKLAPGEQITTSSRFPFNDLFREGYTIGIGILNPESEKPEIELAMNKEYRKGINLIYQYDGNTGITLGKEKRENYLDK